LSAQFQIPLVLDDAYWQSKYESLEAPLLVDIGTAKGGFIKALATDRAEACTKAKNGARYNLLGIEIYEPLVEAANAWVQSHAADLKRSTHFVSCNVNVSMASMRLPNLRAVCVQFPDPWSRGRHIARRVVTPEFVCVLAKILPSGGELYCCSDVKPLAEEMYDVVGANDDFILDEATYVRVGDMESVDALFAAARHVPGYDSAHKYAWERQDENVLKNANGETLSRRWLKSNPYDAPTERDFVCEGKWRPVYRFAAIRK
jgi:tRNA (guanine-N7-)-methyltransferase